MDDTRKNTSDGELPIGFGVALAKNEAALIRFWQMSEREKRQVLFDARHIKSNDGMQALVNRIGETE